MRHGRRPQGRAWGPSTIAGNAARGSGILNNELYLGRLVWNRLRYVKDPSTGKRVSRLNEPGRRGEVEELILDLLRERLLAPGTVQTFVAGYTEEFNRDRAGAASRRVEQEQQLSRLKRKLQGLYDAIAEGLRTPGLLAQLQQLEAEREWPLVLNGRG